MFTLTAYKGFHMTFANGVKISVQWGGANYCDNYDMPIRTEYRHRFLESRTAEVMIWDKDHRVITPELTGNEDDNVVGWITTDEVLSLMNKAAAYGGRE